MLCMQGFFKLVSFSFLGFFIFPYQCHNFERGVLQILALNQSINRYGRTSDDFLFVGNFGLSSVRACVRACLPQITFGWRYFASLDAGLTCGGIWTARCSLFLHNCPCPDSSGGEVRLGQIRCGKWSCETRKHTFHCGVCRKSVWRWSCGRCKGSEQKQHAVC